MVDNPDYLIVNWRVSARPQFWRPPTDLFELESCFQVRIEIAGMREEDFELFLDENQLTIRGIRQDTSERLAYHQMEINFGEFFITLDIPGPIESSSVSAEYINGFLWITLPKAQPKQIPINE
jgi:HSP20 family molecular chaperone IbpA